MVNRLANGWSTAINVDSVDGVVTLWVDAPPPFRVLLLFRVGQADEQLTNSGISHLVEHLAFPHDHDADARSNGATSLTSTAFYAWGDPTDAAAFINDITASLTNLPLSRLEQQRSIILVEEETRGRGPLAELLAERFGARAHGVVGFPSLGLHRVGPDDVANWSTRYYTADNAVLCCTGPPPTRLSLCLPRGQKIPAPAGAPVAGPLPRWTAERVAHIGIGVLTDHGPAGGMAHRILERRLYRRLRQDLALSYSVQSASQVIDPQTQHRATIVDAREEKSIDVARHVLEVAEELAARGPTRQELHDDVHILERELEDDPGTLLGFISHAAECFLSNIEVEELDDHIEIRRQLTTAEVRDAWGTAMKTAILLVPPWIVIEPRRLAHRFWPPPEPEMVRGKTFHATGIARVRGGPTITIGDEAVRLDMPKADSRSMQFEECAALLRTGPLARALVAFDGRGLPIDGEKFANSRDLVDRLDQKVPRDRWIDLLPSP